MTEENWQPGDVVLSADGCIWHRPAIIAGFPWSVLYVADPDGPKHRPVTSEHVPERPLTLLVRNGRPALPPAVPGGCCIGERWGQAAQEGTGYLLLGHTDHCPVNPGGFEEIAISAPGRHQSRPGG